VVLGWLGGRPDQIAATLPALAGDASEYITGQTLLVGGGIPTGATRALPKK
jgi:gluconate 5-dehydrogenase